MSIGLIITALVLSVFGGTGVLFFKKRGRTRATKTDPTLKSVALTSPSHGTLASISNPQAPPGLDKKLEKTRGSLFGKLAQFLSKGAAGGVSDSDWESIEEVFLAADVGHGTSQILLSAAREALKMERPKELKEILREVSGSFFSSQAHGELQIQTEIKPLVISIVGVNGAGKTTTIGKLAHQLQKSGRTVLLGAVDTFRAGAISQLKVWADRTGAQFVTGREGADPGAVAFDSVTAAKARGLDVVLLDTAGRLHTKSNLMEELKKIHRVVKKVIPEAPHETWLVIDGTLGQNSVIQAKEFQKAIPLTGVIITKLDGTAKGGAVLAIAAELKLPIRYIGIGESVEDLTPFEPKAFVDAILG